jgi:DNA (cytosine-5)-methyltransferase 1
MPTLCASDYKDPKLVVEDARLMQVAQLTDKKYNEMTGRVYSDEGLCPTIRTMQGGCLEPKVADENIAGKDVLPYRIRKLTPKECWRLMGFTDEDIDKAVAVGMSNAQLYKQAGNSIVVQVLEGIFGEML